MQRGIVDKLISCLGTFMNLGFLLACQSVSQPTSTGGSYQNVRGLIMDSSKKRKKMYLSHGK